MIISISGPGGAKLKVLDEAARFFAKQLLHPRTVQKIELDIEIENRLDVEGECISEVDHKNPRYFTIRLRKQKLDSMIKTLAHEMVHVKQYATGELRDYVRSTSLNRWRGEMIDDEKINYWDRPWEVEAFGREFGLYARFKESIHEKKARKT